MKCAVLLALVCLLIAVPVHPPGRLRAGRARAVEDAVGRLGSTVFEDRQRAVNLLLSLPEAAGAALREAVGSRDPEVSHTAAAVLRNLDRRRLGSSDRLRRQFHGVVRAALDDPAEFSPGSTTWAALSLDLPAAASATADVARRVERSPGRHARAVSLLRALDRKEAADYLAGVLRRGDFLPSVLRDAAEGLISFGGAAVRDDLLAAIRCPFPAARREALRVLSRIGAGTDASWVRASLRDEDARVRAQAATSLCALAGPAAAADLVSLLADPESSVRASALLGLGGVPGQEARRALLGALVDPSAEVRGAALRSLGTAAESGDGPTLGRLMSDPEPKVRALAIVAISHFSSPDEVVEAGLEDASPEVRRVAISATRFLAPPRRRELLARCGDEPDPHLRELRRKYMTLSTH